MCVGLHSRLFGVIGPIYSGYASLSLSGNDSYRMSSIDGTETKRFFEESILRLVKEKLLRNNILDSCFVKFVIRIEFKLFARFSWFQLNLDEFGPNFIKKYIALMDDLHT